MMLTTRDLEVIDFVKGLKVANTSTINDVFFKNIKSCSRRLKFLADKNELKRIRNHLNAEYIYFIKCPKQLKHSLMVSNFYKVLYNKTNILNFKIESEMGSIRPDAVFGYTYHTKSFLGTLEVERSNNGFNYNKYEKFYSSGEYKSFLPVMPTVFIVGDKIKLPDKSDVKYVVISMDLSNLKL